MKKKHNTPAVIWFSNQVKPDETLVINGDSFTPETKVKLTRLLDSDGGEASEQYVTPLDVSEQSLKVVIPAEWQPGVYTCAIENTDECFTEFFVNQPEIWWQQGDSGVDSATQGGWLRFQGNCLCFDKMPVVELISDNKVISLEVTDRSMYSVQTAIPDDLEPGVYQIKFSNGYGGQTAIVSIDDIEIRAKSEKEPMIVDVTDYGADTTGKKDCTLSIIQAIEYLGNFGGGVIYFPAGRYRIDSILRSGVFIKTPLKIPDNVTLRGESMELVSLWWPDQDEPLPSLIEGSNNFTIEELTIYTQGKHSSIITGESNVTINRVRIRVNCYYMTNNNGKEHHKRVVDVDFGDTKLGAAFVIWGSNLKITNCDIYTSNICFSVNHCHGAYLANNKVMAKNFFFFSGCSELIFENNSFIGNQLTAGGSNIALHFGATVCRHSYIGHNTIQHIYGGDHEAFTLDGHGNCYLGAVKNVHGNTLDIVENWQPVVGAKENMRNIYGTAMFIIEGKGRGQYRWLQKYDGKHVTLDEPWKIEPDETSIVSVGKFNGRHLIIGNKMCDTGTAVQLYPPNFECIVAENKTYRASNINSLSCLKKDRVNGSVKVEPSWYNQFIDNEIVEGNCWGGGCTEVDRWLGGETCLNIWAQQFDYYTDEKGSGQGGFISPEIVRDAVLKEDKLRQISIALSLFTIVRRHKIHNNSSIRIRSRVHETLIEGCCLSNSECGIRIDSEIDFEMPKDLGQLFDFDPEDVNVLKFLSPDQILLRNNKFENVKKEYCGNAVDRSRIV